MKFAEVAENVKQLVATPSPKDEFIYALLLAYGTPKATIARLKKGQTNLSKVPGEVLLKKKVWFREVGRDRRARRDGQLGDLSLPKERFAAVEKMKTAQLYDPDTTKRSEKECHSVTGQRPTSWRGVQMPDGLREAHHQLDLAVDRIYRSKPFASDEERLEHLFKLYEEMTAKEKLI